jgi:DNA-binding LacI/PurR family transcriptional regulator/signal transduction histidine kinase
MWSGISDAVAEHGINLLCFAGKPIHSPESLELPGNIIYDFAGTENVDGIILTGALTVYDKDTNFFDRFRDLPKVIIAMELNGVASIRTNNEIGFRALMAHLIEDHGYRRLAFIGGPEPNVDSEHRKQIYQEVLAEYGIPLNPALMTSGFFHLESSGSDAIKLLLDERKVQFDAVIAANDILALGAGLELKARRIRIPDDIAVTGFDDQEWAEFFIPPLTTVRQSVYQQGKYAVEVLLELLRGETIPKEVFLPTELIIRHSCGCFSKIVTKTAITEIKTIIEEPRKPDEMSIGVWRELVLPEMVQALNNGYPVVRMDWTSQVIDAFIENFQVESSATFLKVLNIILHKATQNDYNIVPWQDVITIMQQYGLQFFKEKSVVFTAENLWHQARILIGEIATQRDVRRVKTTYERVGSLDYIRRIVETTYNLPQLLDALDTHLPDFRIHYCFLSLYENPKEPAGWSRLILGFNEQGRIPLKPEGLRFPTRQIIPAELRLKDKPRSLGVFPLYFGAEQLGFIVFNVTPIAGYIYETLRGIISSAIKVGLLVEKLKEKEQQLEERAAALMSVNNQLEQFAYIVSHDLQESLRMVTGYLQLIERRYIGKLDSEADEFINYAVNGAVRMHGLIDDILTYSKVGSQSKPFEVVDFEVIMEQVKQNLKVAIEENRATVTQDPMPVIMADPGQMVQLLQNLIGNAIKFHGQRPPEVYVSAERQRKGWLFAVRDNGIGLEMKHAGKIFLIFHRLHGREEYPGTGIGLSICKKIIEHHGGRIWVESAPRKGSIFFFTIRT